MSDFMSSAFATFLDQRRTKHHYPPVLHPHDPLLTSSLPTQDVLYPPLHPPFPKRHRSSLTFTDLLHDTPPKRKKIPPTLEQHTTNLIHEKQSLNNSCNIIEKHHPTSFPSRHKSSPKQNGTRHTPHAPPPFPAGPMIGGVPLLNFPNSPKQAPLTPPPQLKSTTPQSTLLTSSSLSVQTLSLLNETSQRPKSTTPRPFACRHEGCSASFIKQNHLSRHIRIVHNKERPYHCTEPGCGSRFGSKSHLGDHTRAVHMRIKLFKCEMCNASWSKRFNLKKHIRVRHLGEKPFRCQQCQLSFGTRSHATRHELKVHKRSPADPLSERKENVNTWTLS